MNAGNREEILKFHNSPHGKALWEWLEEGKPTIRNEQRMTVEAYSIASAEYQGYMRALNRMLKLTEEQKRPVDKKDYIN